MTAAGVRIRPLERGGAAVSRAGVLLESDKQSEGRGTWRVQDGEEGAEDQKRETTDREK